MCHFSQKRTKIRFLRFLQYFEFSSTKTRFFEDEKGVILDHRLKTNRHMYIKGKKKFSCKFAIRASQTETSLCARAVIFSVF